MEWEEMTTYDLEEYAKKEDAVAIVPVGCLEAHGPHLPLGTDILAVEKIALLAAEREEVVVLPPLPYAWTSVHTGYGGAINMKAEVLLTFWGNIFDEIARNGFKKIILLNGHGGNKGILWVFIREFALKNKDYTIYYHNYFSSKEVDNLITKLRMDSMEHADEVETSIMLYLYPELCQMDKVPKTRIEKTKDFDVKPAIVGFEWATNWTKWHNATGAPYKATAEKGEKLVELFVKILIELIKKVKADDKVLDAKKKFHQDASG